MFLLVGLASNAGTALSVMPEKYEATQCVELASKYQWPWKAICVPAPKLAIMKKEKLSNTWLADDGVNICTNENGITSCTLLHVEKK